MYSYMQFTVRLERKCMIQNSWKFRLEVCHQKFLKVHFNRERERARDCVCVCVCVCVCMYVCMYVCFREKDTMHACA